MAQTTLLFGKTGSGKTTSMGEAATYLYRRTGGKIGRAIYSDLGGYKTIQGIVEAGIIEPYNITGEPNMPTLLHKLAQGYWPTNIENGLRVPGTKLVAPTSATWDKVGFYLYEGLTSSAELLMKYLRDKQIAIGGDPVGKFTIKSSDSGGRDEGLDAQFCANNMKHYDWVQGEMIVMLAEFTALPVEKVLISAHEAQGTDEDTRDPIRGAALVGKAATGKIGKNVGDYIHYETYAKTVGDKVDTSIRAYFKAHPDPKFANIMYDCKSRIPLAQEDELLKQFPGGYFDPKRLGEFLEACDKAVDRSTVAARALRARIDAELMQAKAIGGE